MAAWTLFLFTLICLLVIDLLGRLLVRQSRKQSFYKPAGLMAMFTLALNRGQVLLLDQNASLKRFFLASSTACAQILVIATLLFQMVNHEGSGALVIAMFPLLLLPLYYLLFGLLGMKPMPLRASIGNFRLRGILSLVIGANLCFINLYNSKPILVLSIHTVFILLALIDLLHLLSQLRSNANFYNIDNEDTDTGPTAFFHYINALLEFFFYCALISLTAIKAINIDLINISYFIWPMIGTLLLIGIAFLGQKIFLRSESALGLLYFERSIVPLSFLVFGMAFVIQGNL